MSTPSDTREHLDVLVVGAGLSGIAAGHHLQTTCGWASYAIFEARDAIGGTWDLFRYPGIRSDSDMHTLGYPFRPWTGDTSIGDGGDIRRYIEDTARAEGIDRHIRFGHRIISADWSTPDAHWNVTAERTDDGERVELTCGFLFSCSGYYRYDQGHTPDFPGLDDFTGQVIHPQFWPEDFDGAGARIVVIGSGATAVTLIPSLTDTAAHVTMLQRSPSYIAAIPSTSPAFQLFRRVLPDRPAGAASKWFHALTSQGMYRFCQRFPRAARAILRKGVEQQLPSDYDIDTHFTPRYDPWDQRLCADPDGAFFSAIRRGDASVVTDRIDRFTPTGIRLESGTELDADIVITATGLELLFIGGIAVSVDGDAVDAASRLMYKGMMLQDVPNFAAAFGYTNASWTLKCDLTCDLVARLLNEMRDRDRAQCTPRNRDPAMTTEPMLSLSSGYIQRSKQLFPLQGSRSPWRVYQSYLHDYRAMKRGELVDDALELTNPTPTPTPTPPPTPATAGVGSDSGSDS